VFEPKVDGFRGMLYLDREVATFRSKRGLVLARFAELAHALRETLGVRTAILDGEVLALDSESHPDFKALIRGTADRLLYAAFDLLWLNGRDLRAHSLVRRRRALERLVPKPTPILSPVMAVDTEGVELFEAVQRLDLEGIVAKRKEDPHGPKTVRYKIKNRGYTQMEGRFEMLQRKG
jgi:bifunctional non-homologous end joining protein LigD